MTEAELKRDVKAYLDKMGFHHVHYNTIFSSRRGNYGSAKGIPDIIGCYRGRYIAFELKGKGGKPSEAQNRQLESIKAAEGMGIIVRSVDEVEAVLWAIDQIIDGGK